MANFLTKLFGSHSSHELKKIYPIADKVDALEEPYKKLTDAELRAKTDEFKARYQNGETLDDLLPEAFATCREAAWRVLGMRHYRVQVIGGGVPSGPAPAPPASDHPAGPAAVRAVLRHRGGRHRLWGAVLQ